MTVLLENIDVQLVNLKQPYPLTTTMMWLCNTMSVHTTYVTGEGNNTTLSVGMTTTTS